MGYLIALVVIIAITGAVMSCADIIERVFYTEVKV